MKNTLRNVLLKAAFVAAIALPFSAQMAKAATITANLTDVTNQNIQNYPTPKVTITNDGQPTGTLKIRVEVVPGPTGGTADLRGFFFNLPAGVTNSIITRTAGGPITNISGTGVNATTLSLGNSANLNGANATFGVGVEIGSQGIGGNPPDDFQFVEFTLSGNGLTLAGFSQAQFGVRMMSVSTSAGGARDGSSKTLGNGGTVVNPSPSPSPSPTGSPSPSPSPSPTGSPSPSPSPTGSPSPSPSPSGSPSPSPSPSGSPSPSPSTPTGGGGGGGGTPPDVAEPITIIGMGLGLGGLLLSRRNRNKNK